MTSDGITIERSRHAQEFVIIGNAEARDKRLSFRARGLHHHLLSLPPGWRVTTTDLAKEHPEGRDAIRTALAELVALGYVTKSKRQDEHGHWSTTMTVHDRPQSAEGSQQAMPGPVGDQASGPAEVDGGTEDGFPGVGHPGVGESGAIQKTVNEDVKDQKMAQERASRRAQSSGSRAQRTVSSVIADVRKAAVDAYGEQDAEDITDNEALGLYFTFATPKKQVRDVEAYMTRIFEDGPTMDTFLANSAAACRYCQQWEDDCKCGAETRPAA